MAKSPKVFISHKSVDKPWAEQLARSLRESGIDAWLDKWEIAPGDSILSQIEEGIRASAFLVLILTPDSVSDSARWVTEEWRTFLNRQLNGYDIKLIPILLRDTEVPPMLAHRKYIDFREPRRYSYSLNELKNAILAVDNRPPLSEQPDAATLHQRPYGEIRKRGTMATIELGPTCRGDLIRRFYEMIEHEPEIREYKYVAKGSRYSTERIEAVSVTTEIPIPENILLVLTERAGLTVTGILYNADEIRIEKGP